MKNNINKLLDSAFRKRKKIEIRITWRFIIYLFYIIISMFFVSHAYLEVYNTWLAGILWIQFIISYIFSIYLIRRID